jgi:TRAP-type mannitol/chloroaromatic compound transport system substrate-binding protein
MIKVKSKMQKIMNGGENMKRKKLGLIVSLILTAVLVSVVLLPGCAEEPEPEVYELTIQSGYPRGDISMGLLEVLADSAYDRSDGRLVIEVYAEPEIVPLDELFMATKAGTLDMLQCGGTFWGGIVPVGEIEFGIPFAYDIPEELTFTGKAEEIRRFFFEAGFVDILREEYGKQNLYWLDMHTYGPVTLHSTVAVSTMGDLTGLKVRDEGLWSEFHNALGMEGVSTIDIGDVYSALETGLLDMTQWDVSAITGLAWHEPAPYWVHPHQNEHIIGHILVNMDSWNALPADLQDDLADAAADYWDECVETYEEEVANAYDAAGVEVVWLDEAAQTEWRAEALELWDELATRDAACAEAIALLKAWRGV